MKNKLEEQRFNVLHRLTSWKENPTPDNWDRVLDAVTGYAPEGEPQPGQFFVFERSGGKGDRRALGRYTRKGTRYGQPHWKSQAFRKGSRTWTKS